MGKCIPSFIAYFQVQNFIDNLDSNKSHEENYKELIADISDGFLIDLDDNSSRDLIISVLDNTVSNNSDFINYVKTEINKKGNNAAAENELSNEKKTPTIQRNPMDTPKERVITNSISTTPTKLKLNTPFKNRLTLSQNYFGNDTYLFGMFESKIKKDIFRTAIVDYNIDNPHSIRTNAQLNSNIFKLYNGYKQDLIDFLASKKVGNDTYVDDESLFAKAAEYFSKYNTNLNDLLDSGDFIAYSKFVILNNGFDNMLDLYGLGVIHSKYNLRGDFSENAMNNVKYNLSNSNKFAFSYGNDNYSILDETTDLLKTLITTTPIVKKNGSKWIIDENQFLDTNSTMAAIVKMKGVSSGLSKQSRYAPTKYIYENLKKIVNNETYAKRYFTTDELNILRTLYAFYYSDSDDTKVKSLKISSLSSIYAKEFAANYNLNNDNDLFVNITRQFDVAAHKLYTGLNYNKDINDWELITLSELNVNQKYKININNFNNLINNNYRQHNIEFSKLLNVNNKSVKLGNLDVKINEPFGFLNNVTSVKVILDKQNKKQSLNENERLLYDSIVEADRILNTGLFLDNNRGINLLTESGEDSNSAIAGLLKLAAHTVYLAHVKNESDQNKAEGVSVENSIKSVLAKEAILSYDDYLKNDKLISFSNQDTDSNIINFLKRFSDVQNRISGDSTKAIVKSLSGSSMPTIGIMSPTHDDNTNISEVENYINDSVNKAIGTGRELNKNKKLIAESIPAYHNLFGQTNYNGTNKTAFNRNIIAGEHLKTAISIDDEAKDPGKMSAAEIFTSNVLFEFFGNIHKNGYAALQPLVYADKIGQMLKRFNMTGKIIYNNQEYDLSKMNPQQLADLHYKTISGQYLTLEKTIVSDLIEIFQQGHGYISDVIYEKLANPFILGETHPLTDYPMAIATTEGGINYDDDGNIIIAEEYRSPRATALVEKINNLNKLLKNIISGNVTKYEEFSPILELLSEEDLVSIGKRAGVNVAHEVHYSGRKGRIKANNQLIIEFNNYRSKEVNDKRMNIERLKMVRDMFKMNTVIDCYNFDYSQGQTQKSLILKQSLLNAQSVLKERIPDFNINDWINNNTGELILAKTINGNPVTYEDLIPQKSENSYVDPIRNNTNDFVINPLLDFFFQTHNLMTSNYNLITAGGIHAHELKGKDYDPTNDNKLNDSAKQDTLLMDQLRKEGIISSRTTASDKRNVFAQATAHTYIQDLVNGMPLEVDNAIINDTSFDLFNMLAQQEGFKNFDGSAFMTAFAMILGDNSLGSMATKSFTHKLIHHQFNPRTMSALMEKYAVFGLTNELIRKTMKSPIMAINIMRKMTDRRLSISRNVFNLFNSEYVGNTLISPVKSDESIKMFNYLNNVKVLDNKGEIYEIIGFRQNTDSYGHYSYTPVIQYVGQTELTELPAIKIDSVFDIWQALGGQNSVTETIDGNLKGKDGKTYIYSEKSNYDTVEILNGYRKLKDPNKKEFIASNYDQPLKHAMIYQLNNASGIKNGAININPASSWTDNKELYYFKVNTLHWGIQGNFDHGFDEEHVALLTEMSQVISAAAVNGHYQALTNNLYESIAQVVAASMNKYNTALAKAANGSFDVYLLLTKEMMNLLGNKDEIGFAQVVLDRIEQELNKIKAVDGSIDTTAIMSMFKTPFSDNNFFGSMISMLSGMINRTSIKRKYSGLASIIKPGHDLYTIAVDKNGNIVNGEFANEELVEISENNDVFFGDRINISINGKHSLDVDFHNPDDYIDYKSNPVEFIKDYIYKYINDAGLQLDTINYEVKKVTNYARNLQGYKVYYTDENGIKHDRFELNSVKARYELRRLNKAVTLQQEINKFTNDLSNNLSNFSQYEIQRTQDEILKKQQEIEAIKSKVTNLTSVIPDFDVDGFINGQYSKKNISDIEFKLLKLIEKDHLLLEEGKLRNSDNTITKVTTEVKSGECLMSNYNRLKYGIEKGTRLQDVNYDYFLKKLNNSVKITTQKHSEFYVTSLKGDQEIHFAHASTLEKVDNKEVFELLTKDVEDDEGNITSYVIDPNTGTLLFKHVDGLKAYLINGVLHIQYNNASEINTILNDKKFHYQSLNVNFKGNKGIITKYLSENNRIFSKEFSLELLDLLEEAKLNKTKIKDLENQYKNLIISENKYKAFKLEKSWKKQLEVIAARIPAQSLQSFMAMEIVGFVDDDINAVILPTMKNWLDGSDFDIDKTYMMGFGVDANGFLYRYNNYFNDSDAESSYLHMVLPSGIKYDKKENTDFKYSHDDVLKNAAEYADAPWMKQRTDPELLKKYKDFLEVVKVAKTEGAIIINTALTPLFEEILINTINDYHANTPSNEIMLEASKNAVTQSLISISKKIGNIFSAERPVDMDDPRDATTLTDKAQDARELARENPASIAMQIIQQNAGKSVVGVSAVGEKVFMAASTYLNNKVTNLAESIKLMIPEDAKQYAFQQFDLFSSTNPIIFKDGSAIIPNFLANCNFVLHPQLNEYYQEWLTTLKVKHGYDQNDDNVIVLNVNNQKDASLVISAVLSAATDNAKELILDKINAGPELAGVYMYMIMKGVNFMDIAKIMISPVINKVVSKSKQNWFSKNNKGNNIDNAITFYLEGVNPYDYFEGSSVWKVKEVLAKLLNQESKDFEFKNLSNLSVSELNQLLENYNQSNNDVVNTSIYSEGELISIGSNYHIKFSVNKMINDLINRKNTMTNYGQDQFIDELIRFNQIRKEAKETEILGRRLSINQGMKTKQYDKYGYDYSLNSYIYSQLKDNSNGHNSLLQELETNKDLKNQMINKNLLSDEGELLESSLLKFMTDIKALHDNKSDGKLAEQIYEHYKSFINIIGIELTLPHFSSMIKSAYTVEQILSKASSRYDGINKIIKQLGDKKFINPNKDGFYGKVTEEQFNSISNFIVSKYIEEFFSNPNISFNIKQNDEYVELEDFNYVKRINNDETKVISLDTPEGKASFKNYFETFLIPTLQKSKKGNKFVDSLVADTKRNSISGSEYIYYKLNFDMNSINNKNKNPNADLIFSNIKDGFEQLKGASIDGNNIWEMFAIYNILINKNSFGVGTFTKLFQSTSYVNDENAIFYKFMEFEGDIDLNPNKFLEVIEKDQSFLNDLGLRSASIEPYVKKATNTSVKFFKVYNKVTRKNDIYERKYNTYVIKPLLNSENNIDNYLIDDFLTDTVSHNLNLSYAQKVKLMDKINENIDSGNILLTIKCD